MAEEGPFLGVDGRLARRRALDGPLVAGPGGEPAGQLPAVARPLHGVGRGPSSTSPIVRPARSPRPARAIKPEAGEPRRGGSAWARAVALQASSQHQTRGGSIPVDRLARDLPTCSRAIGEGTSQRLDASVDARSIARSRSADP